MVANILPTETPLTQGVGSKGQTISFPESSHLAYQKESSHLAYQKERKKERYDNIKYKSIISP